MVVSSTSMKVGTTTTAATSHGFAAAELLEGERAASVICQDQPSSWMDQWLARKAYRLVETSRHRRGIRCTREAMTSKAARRWKKQSDGPQRQK